MIFNDYFGFYKQIAKMILLNTNAMPYYFFLRLMFIKKIVMKRLKFALNKNMKNDKPMTNLRYFLSSRDLAQNFSKYHFEIFNSSISFTNNTSYFTPILDSFRKDI